MNIPTMREKAESGNVAAQTILGICYLDGIGVEVDYRESFRLLSIAAKSGAPRAIANLARIYGEGLGIVRNASEAIRLYETAAKAGEFNAQIALGRIYSNETDIPANPEKARIWYSAALAQVDRIGDCQEIQEAKDYLTGASDHER